jgi:hypothetical protein
VRKKLAAALFAGGLLGSTQDPIADIMMGNRGVRVTLTGNLIDVDCFAEHGGFGPEHAECSRFCAAKGLQAALLDAKGRFYLIQGQRHQAMELVNSQLLKFVESTVVIRGELLERGELRVLVVEKVEHAEKQTPWSEIRTLYEGRKAR